MAHDTHFAGMGASRLFAKFLLILVPVFLISAAIGLSLIGERMAHTAHDQLTSRIRAKAGKIAAVLGRRVESADTAGSQDLLSTLLHDPAILCAEVRPRSNGAAVLSTPQGLGCVGQDDAEHFQIPAGKNHLHVRFTTVEVAATRQSYREFSLVALLVGLLVSAGASYISFRVIVGKPLKALLLAIRQSDEKGKPVYAPAKGNDELGAVIRAYNHMRTSLAEETSRTLQKSAELSAARHRNEEFLSAVFQVSPYPFAILDPQDGTYLNVNEAWLSTMRYDRHDVIGQSAHDLGIWTDQRERARFVGLLKREGAVSSFEAQVQTRTGEFLDMLMSGQFVDFDGISRLFMVADDVTELKKAERQRNRHNKEILSAKTRLEVSNLELVQRTQELEAAQETLVRQERLATLGELTATVSHELRNPLAAIRSSVHLAIQKTKDLEIGVDRSLMRAERNVVRCDSIISDLLGYASEPKCEPEKIIADDWLQETLSELPLPESVGLTTNFAAPAARVVMIPERIRQVVVNIFENAVHALADMPDGKARRLMVSTAVSSGQYTMAFEDSGPGMDAGMVENAFKPLFSTKSYGCGLGLATAKKIMERHDGAILVESKIGTGTVFTMCLPAQSAKEKAA